MSSPQYRYIPTVRISEYSTSTEDEVPFVILSKNSEILSFLTQVRSNQITRLLSTADYGYITSINATADLTGTLANPVLTYTFFDKTFSPCERAQVLVNNIFLADNFTRPIAESLVLATAELLQEEITIPANGSVLLQWNIPNETQAVERIPVDGYVTTNILNIQLQSNPPITGLRLEAWAGVLTLNRPIGLQDVNLTQCGEVNLESGTERLELLWPSSITYTRDIYYRLVNTTAADITIPAGGLQITSVINGHRVPVHIGVAQPQA